MVKFKQLNNTLQTWYIDKDKETMLYDSEGEAKNANVEVKQGQGWSPFY